MNIPELSTVIVEETALGILLIVALVIYAVMSLIFRYHWRRFSIPTPGFRKVRHWYYVVSTSLVVLSVVLYGAIIITF